MTIGQRALPQLINQTSKQIYVPKASSSATSQGDYDDAFATEHDLLMARGSYEFDVVAEAKTGQPWSEHYKQQYMSALEESYDFAGAMVLYLVHRGTTYIDAKSRNLYTHPRNIRDYNRLSDKHISRSTKRSDPELEHRSFEALKTLVLSCSGDEEFDGDELAATLRETVLGIGVSALAAIEKLLSDPRVSSEAVTALLNSVAKLKSVPHFERASLDLLIRTLRHDRPSARLAAVDLLADAAEAHVRTALKDRLLTETNPTVLSMLKASV